MKKSVQQHILKSYEQRESGFVLWTGKSQLTGDKVALIVILESSNRKTGNIFQCYLINVKDFRKREAGCLGCKHLYKGCYVTNMGVSAVSRAYHKGNYKSADFTVLNGAIVRLDANFDRAALPLYINKRLAIHPSRRLSYTHFWQDEKYSFLKSTAMASVDNLKELKEAKKKSWATFRITNNLDTMQPYERRCPHDVNKAIQCIDCQLCDGEKEVHIVVEGHGSKARLNHLKVIVE